MESQDTYSYKVVRVNGGMLALRRAIIYFCILLFIVSTALVVLFLLFERYMMLFLCAGMYVLAFFLLFISGRGESCFMYHIGYGVIEIQMEKGERKVFRLTDSTVLRIAVTADEDSSETVKFCFPNNRIVGRNISKEGLFKKYLLTMNGAQILLLLDTYALVLLQRRDA